MTDKQFQKVLDKLSVAQSDYRSALQTAEAEYERRFGTNPSDISDDFWIDTFHVNDGSATVEAVTESARTHLKYR